MDRLIELAYRIARLGAWGGGLLVLLSALLISVDVALRKIFVLSVGGASEVSGYVMAISWSWALAFTLLDRAHIRIDSLYLLLPVRVCAALDVLSLAAMLLLACVLTWYGWEVFHQSFQLGSRALTPLATPLEYPQFLWVFGLGFFVIVIALLLVRASYALVTGDIGTVQRIAGSRTSEQELEAELESLRNRQNTTGAAL
jgi:TRAP-type mannitol/chloroaromatic compound transport system permease small subunit